MSTEPSTVGRPVTPGDIEAKLRQLQGEVDTTTESAKPIALMVGVGVAVVVAVGFYLLGRREGKQKSTVVEIRRV